MRESSKTSLWVIAMVCGLSAAAWGQPLLERPMLPERVEPSRDRLVENAVEFIDLRMEVLLEAVLAFGRYIEAVATNGQVTSEMLVYGPVLAMDDARNTERVLEEFYNSPEAAYLTAADREYLRRKYDEAEKHADERMEARFNEFLTPEVLSEADFDVDIATEVFLHGAAALDVLVDPPEALIPTYLALVHGNLKAGGHENAWRALLRRDADALDAFDAEFGEDVLWQATVTGVESLCESHLKTLPETGCQIVLAVLAQQWAGDAQGMIFTTPEDYGINALLGRDTRRRLTGALRNAAWGVPAP